MAKKFQVKVYTKDDEYITTWKDVVSDVSFNNEINTAGGQLILNLARNVGDYGEGSDVDFGHKVKIYVIDRELPVGELIYQGYISSYTPIYNNNTVQVTVLTYGAELSDYMIEDGEEYLFGQTEKDNNLGFGVIYTYETQQVAQTFTSTKTTKLSRIALYLDTGFYYDYTDGNFYKREEVDVEVEVRTGGTIGSGTSLGTATGTLTAEPEFVRAGFGDTLQEQYREYSFEFDVPLDITISTVYHFIVRPLEYNYDSNINYMAYIKYDTNNYAGGSNWRYIDNVGPTGKDSTWVQYSSNDLYFKLYEQRALTYANFTSQDPSKIVRQILDTYNNNGGIVSYTNESVLLTNTVVSYTFNANTVYEGISKCVELAPKDWYWYLDYGTNLINFKLKNPSAEHIFTLGKDILDANFEKRIEDIVNVLYFIGGDTGGGSNLFKKYEVTDSVEKYGVKSMKYSDTRVTLESTADTISNSILSTRSEPELRVTLKILDSNNDKDKGYDIESIKVGQTIAVRNITQQVGLSTWDVGRWDDSYWDFNIYNLSSLLMQIQKINYEEDFATIYASTIPVDVNKRIEDINRNLEALQSANNPESPI